MIGYFNRDASFAKFDQLPPQFQTVIASVAFQYGVLPVRTPTFWSYAVTGNWTAMIAELRNFGDAFPTRRTKEADLMERTLREAVVEERSRLRDMIRPPERDR